MHQVRIRDLPSISLPSVWWGKVSNETHLALSIFDNAFSTVEAPTASSSSAVVVLLDLEARTAQVIERYPHPDLKHGALFGSVQFLATGDRFIGWGGALYVSQHTQDNELVFHAQIAEGSELVGSFCTFKGLWHAKPLIKPDLHSYSWATLLMVHQLFNK